MRHYNPYRRYSYRFAHNNHVCNGPYQQCYTYTRPTMKCWYVKILQYVYDHPNCTRNEILCGIFPDWFKNVDEAKKWGRGYASNTFANMLFDNLIDYDKNYRYTICDNGIEVLKRAYMIDIAKKFTK